MVTRFLSLALLTMFQAGAAHWAAPAMVELNTGETVEVTLDGQPHKIRLVSFREQTEPYYEPANQRVVDAVVAATVTLDVDGRRADVAAGPFRMPATVGGVAVMVDATRGWAGGIAKDELEKDVRLELQSASVSWYPADRFVFPVADYRWRAVNYQHTFLGVVVSQPRLYFHRGEDFGMLPDHVETRAVDNAVVRVVPGPKGDGGSNGFIIANEEFMFRYAHMNTPNIVPELQPGVAVQSGQKLGLTGNTWRGAPVRDPHLHIEMRNPATNRHRHTFPFIVAAYRHSHPGELMPVAGGWRHLYAGDEIELDGSLSLAGEGRRIVSYQWTFTDGATARGARVKRRYPEPGTYSEQLRVTDNRGQSDLDFVEVFVLPRQPRHAPPYAMLYYYPVRGIRAGDDVLFDIRQSGAATIDYGDGTVLPWSEITHHRYARSGTYVVTLRTPNAGSGPGVFHVRVVVE